MWCCWCCMLHALSEASVAPRVAAGDWVLGPLHAMNVVMQQGVLEVVRSRACSHLWEVSISRLCMA